MNPFISIIIPLYNKENYIHKTLYSILSQNYDNYEIIVIDDGSTDNSAQIVKNYPNNHIHLFSKENGGASSARNYGITKAKGEWLLFLDADDTLSEGALQLVVQDIKRHKHADIFCYCQYVQEGSITYIFPTDHTKGYVLSPFLSWYLGHIYPGPGRMIINKKCMEEEPFREDLKRWEDGENLFRLMRKYTFYANPYPLFTYCRNNNNASKPCNVLSEDFICTMQPEGKSFFEQMAMFKLYKEACLLYPNHIAILYGNTFNKAKYLWTDKILKKYLRLLRRWNHLKHLIHDKLTIH